MTPLVVLAVALFVGAVLFILLLLTSFLAVLLFRFVPTLQGTILSLTPSDLVQILREMPTYPAWWRGGEAARPKQMFVLVVVNPVPKAEYLRGFDPLRRPVFTSNRSEGLQFRFDDLFALETLYIKLEDEGLYPFLTPVNLSTFRSARRRYRRRRRMDSPLTPPLNIYLGGSKLPKRIEPVHAFLNGARRAS